MFQRNVHGRKSGSSATLGWRRPVAFANNAKVEIAECDAAN